MSEFMNWSSLVDLGEIEEKSYFEETETNSFISHHIIHLLNPYVMFSEIIKDGSFDCSHELNGTSLNSMNVISRQILDMSRA